MTLVSLSFILSEVEYYEANFIRSSVVSLHEACVMTPLPGPTERFRMQLLSQ